LEAGVGDRVLNPYFRRTAVRAARGLEDHCLPDLTQETRP